MIGKIILVFLVVFATQGHSLREIRLDDRDVFYIRHTHFGVSIGIAKSFLDTLSSCHLIYPNGVMFEAFPQDRLPHNPNIFFLTAVQPFTSCGIGFRDVGPEFSGTYELLSTVLHTADNSISLTRQRFHIRIIESDFNK